MRPGRKTILMYILQLSFCDFIIILTFNAIGRQQPILGIQKAKHLIKFVRAERPSLCVSLHYVFVTLLSF